MAGNIGRALSYVGRNDQAIEQLTGALQILGAERVDAEVARLHAVLGHAFLYRGPGRAGRRLTGDGAALRPGARAARGPERGADRQGPDVPAGQPSRRGPCAAGSGAGDRRAPRTDRARPQRARQQRHARNAVGPARSRPAVRPRAGAGPAPGRPLPRVHLAPATSCSCTSSPGTGTKPRRWPRACSRSSKTARAWSTCAGRWPSCIRCAASSRLPGRTSPGWSAGSSATTKTSAAPTPRWPSAWR